MNQNISSTSWVANDMVRVGFAAGAVTALLTLGLAECVGRLVAWNGRLKMADRARQRCQEVEQFTEEMAKSFDRLATELDRAERGMTCALPAGLRQLQERNMWFLEENYRGFVLKQRRTHPSEIHKAIGDWVVAPIRQALDDTRSTVGRQVRADRRGADRRRLNECIRRTENELVECASRLLSTDVSRPGEGTHNASVGKWRRRCLGMLAILALPIGCVPRWNAKEPTPRVIAHHVAVALRARDHHSLGGREEVRHAVPPARLRIRLSTEGVSPQRVPR